MVFAVNASKRRHRSSSGGSSSSNSSSSSTSSSSTGADGNSGGGDPGAISPPSPPPPPPPSSSSQDDQLFLAPPTVQSSKVQRGVERPTSPHAAGPAAKRARMNVDYNVHFSGSRSVAQRLKQCSLKDLNNTSNGNLTFKTPSLPGCRPSPKLTPKQHNTVRVIAQYLRDLGLKESLDTLTEESGCKVENANARKLREDIYKGKWDDAIAVLEKCYANMKPHQYETAKLLILEEKFYDLMHSNNTPMALRLLREEFPNRTALREKRSSMIRMLFMSKQQLSEVPEAMRYRTKRDRRKLVVKVQRVLPPTFILPPARLEQLLNQAHATQVSKCRVHLQKESFEGLEAGDVFVDHRCQRRSSRGYLNTQVTITDHKYEVWCVEFSPDGKLLASCSKSSRVLIHSVSSKGKRVEILHHLAGYDTAEVVSCMSWSADSKLLAVACTEQAPFDIMVFDAREGRLLRTVDNLPNSLFTTCAFFNASNYFLIVGDERGHLQICDIKLPTETYVLGFWEGYRIRGVYGMSDCHTVLASDTHHRLRRYRFDNREDETVFTEEVPIISFRVHPNERFVLTTTQRNLRMWDLQTKTLVRNFYGAQQGNLVIHAGFGGINHEYLATGTEDHKVIIWGIGNSKHALKLRGHRRVVNGVTWNPKYSTLLASCSQDGTVRIWNIARNNGPPELPTSKKKGHKKAGSQQSNGKEKRKRR